MFYLATSHGLGFYLGCILYLSIAFFKIIQLVSKIDTRALISLGEHAYSGFIVVLTAKLLRRKSVVRISEPTRYIV